MFFGDVSLTKNNDIDRYKYSGYGIGFDRKGTFSVCNGFGRNYITFGVDMSSAAHVDNKKKDISILGEGPTQGLDGTALTVEKKNSWKEFNELKNIHQNYYCLNYYDINVNKYRVICGTSL